MLSNTCKYAIRAVTYLASISTDGQKVGIKRIATELNIPSPFLGKILQQLAKNKLLVSTKGPHGGFALARDASQITLLDIVDIIDGKDIFEECLLGLKICNGDPVKKQRCAFHPKSDPVRKRLYELFSKQTVGELADRFSEDDVVGLI